MARATFPVVRLRVVVACSGLGRVSRGYESFAQQCHDALRQKENIEVRLARADHPTQADEVHVWSLGRGSVLSTILGRLLMRDSYFVEQISFLIGMVPLLWRFRPNIILVSDWSLARWLSRCQRLLNLRYRVVLSNGAPALPPFPDFDHVQHVTRVSHHEALAAGESPDKHSYLPYGFNMDAVIAPRLTRVERSGRKAVWGLDPTAPLVISVGAVNRTQKRQDFLIRVCSRSDKRPSLLILGQRDNESSSISLLGEQLLGGDRFQILTLAARDMEDAYAAADIFALASLNEGFGRAFVEALSMGLPCLVHDTAGAREILGPYGIYVDMTNETEAADALDAQLGALGDSIRSRESRHSYVWQRFSWDVLADEYVALFATIARSHRTRRREH